MIAAVDANKIITSLQCVCPVASSKMPSKFIGACFVLIFYTTYSSRLSSIHHYYKLNMESSFFLKLSEAVSQTECECETPVPTSTTIDNLEPQLPGGQSTLLVRFQGDKITQRFDPDFLKYALGEVVCENEEEAQVITSHCCLQNAGFFHEIGNKVEELKCYEMMLREDPKHLPSLSKAALLNFEMDRLDESVRHYKTINLLYPNNAQAYFNLAATLRRADRSREAKTALEKYLQLAPSDPEGYKDMADVMIELGEKNTAVQILQKCLQACPKDSQVLNTLGNLHFSTNPERAIEYYLEGITANPHNSYNYNALGVVYNSMGWHQRAVSEFDRAIALHPAEADFHYNLALAHKQLKHIDAAERQFKIALQVDPSYYLSYQGLGNLSQQAHHFSQAIAYYELSLQACPDFTNAVYNLALAYQSNGDLPQAAKCLQRYVQLLPTDFNAYHQLAIIRSAMRCKERAVRQREPVLTKTKGKEGHEQ